MAVKFLNQKEVDSADFVRVNKPVRIVPHGETTAKVFVPGDLVRVSGIGKLQLHHSGDATVITEAEAAALKKDVKPHVPTTKAEK